MEDSKDSKDKVVKREIPITLVNVPEGFCFDNGTHLKIEFLGINRCYEKCWSFTMLNENSESKNYRGEGWTVMSTATGIPCPHKTEQFLKKYKIEAPLPRILRPVPGPKPEGEETKGCV